MKLAVRICLYLLLVLLAGDSFSRFRKAYLAEPGVDRTALPAAAVPDEKPLSPPPADPSEVDTNRLATEDATNALTLAVTNAVSTNEVAGSATLETTHAVAAVETPPTRASSKKANALVHLGLFVAAMLGLGGLGAWEVARYLGNRAGRAIMAEDWVVKKDPGYEKAEEEWARGNHLDAITLMREYLKKNPSEQHVALRIAEIYEKDLGNFLAAALELEEVLTKKLPRERWGWTAIRLSNLYSGRLNQPDKAMALLDRIVQDYSETGAAKKARQRLGLPEPDEATGASTPGDDTSGGEPPPDASNPSLPKGFRPRK
jgi:tetratricopeptide (TPR) repeat protein